MTPRADDQTGAGDEELYSIGDVAEDTGVAVDTIRVWERRYGRPVPVRLPSGHRRYTGEHVRWLRRVAEALAAGHRPGKVVKLGERELDELLGAMKRPDRETANLDRILAFVREYRRGEVEAELYGALESQGPNEFLARTVAPLLTEIGRRWADGDLEIRHEHFTSQIIEDILRTLRQNLDVVESGPIVLLTTLSGEWHSLGLHMAALACTMAGSRPIVLGVDSPNEEITHAARECTADVVAVSVSLSSGGVKTDRVLADLRKGLPDDVLLVVGGRGARGVRRGPRGIDYLEGLQDLERYLEDLE